MSLPPTSSVSSTISSNPKTTTNLISNTTTSSTGGVSINFSSRNSTSSVLSSSPKSQSTDPPPGPVSLPSWAGEKRSVKQLAASLARQQSQEDVGKKKTESLPRNSSPPAPTPTLTGKTTVPDVVEHPQGLHANCFLVFLN